VRTAWHKTLEGLARHLVRHSVRWILAGALLTVVSVFFITKLQVKSDFMELLPQRFQSVADLKIVVAKVGGLGNLSVALQSVDVKASERLADDLATILRRDFNDRILYLDYKIDPVKKFYTDNAALFMDLDQIESIKTRVNDKILGEKRKRLPLFDNIADDVPAESTDDFADIEIKYKEHTARFDKYIDGYYTGEGGKLLVMMIKPQGSSTDAESMKKLIADIDGVIQKLSPAHYASDMTYGFAGNYKIGLEEFEALKHDIFSTALLCASLVGLAIFLFFRRLRAVALLTIACAAAVGWTFGVTYFAIGYLNTVTAFLGAIIAGTGINYGIILLARYFEERRLGHVVEDAIETAMTRTASATLGAAATTAVAFGTFMIADVRSFSQFGFIGSLGMLLIWLASYSLLPAMIILSERIWPSVHQAETTLMSERLRLDFLSFPLRYPRAVLAVFSTLATAAALVFAFYLPNSLEYDMSKLRTKSSMESGTAKLDERIAGVFDVSMTPSIIVANNAEHARQICEALLATKKAQGDESMVDTCRSAYSLIPDQQAAKLKALGELRTLLDDPALEDLTPEQKKRIDDIRLKMPRNEVALTDVPKELSRHFTDKEGNLGTFVFVYPKNGRDLWIASNLFAFTDTIRRINMPDGKVVTSSGDSVIFADLLRLMKRDCPLATTVSFVGVFLVVLLLFGSLRASIYVASSLLFGSLIMVGLMAAAQIKLNFFNFVALPITFGIGVDYGINVYKRYTQEGFGSMPKVLRRTGPAVFLCSLTTIIGYFTLIIADSKALFSLGGLAILGELTCLSAGLIALPALIALKESQGSTDTVASRLSLDQSGT